MRGRGMSPGREGVRPVSCRWTPFADEGDGFRLFLAGFVSADFEFW